MQECRISVITPLHADGNRFILATYESLLSQTVTDWEWEILENKGGFVPDEVRSDPRVRVSRQELQGVGLLKKTLSVRSNAGVVLELDADDLLHEAALECVLKAVAEGADFVFSDFAQFVDGTWQARTTEYPFGERYGWSSYPVEFRGHELIAMRAPPASAHNLRLVDWAPNHLRAWTRAAYAEVGGHDPAFELADDHELCVKMYLAGKKMVHVDRCLYFQRTHARNTSGVSNAKVRALTETVYNRCIWALAEKWSRDSNLTLVDLCGGVDAPPGYLVLDQHAPEGGIACDLEGAWPLEDSSVGLLRAHDAVEHLKDAIHTMNEAYRVLAPGGFLMIHVPSTNGLGAFCDPTHVSFWNRLSFRYYTDRAFARYVTAFQGRFQVSRVIEWFPSEWHRQNNVPYVEAHLIALKDGYTPMGEVLW